VPERHRIEQLRQRVESSPSLRLLIVQQITLVSRHGSILLAIRFFEALGAASKKVVNVPLRQPPGRI
jgi:hypothetical protein